MIYIYNKEGQCSKCSNTTVPIIMEYIVYKHGEKDEKSKQEHHMYVACPNWEYVKSWCQRNEFTALDETSCSFMRTPYWCVYGNDGSVWAYWSRGPIRVIPDNTIDYHLYYNGKDNVTPYMNEYEWEEKTGLYCKY